MASLACRSIPGLAVSRVSVRPRGRRLAMSVRATSSVTEKKAKLIEAIEPLGRGVSATSEDKANIESLVQALEEVNPNPESLASPLINGKWLLIYTTSDSILGTSRPAFLRPNGPIFQTIDAKNLKARNTETWPFFSQVSAELTPLSKSEVKVQFIEFKIFGLLPVKAPETATGRLDTTFVDEELRISRGDKGNLFVLKMADPEGKP
ncbi:hypothetical protein BSKO_08762 [Bryopsis sp. KO-2023]|nr:hypothetical protein BSKO_08762 [Bryopsis sp. KO-2023]